MNYSASILRAFRRRLTNLSSRNRSLLLTSLPAGQYLDLHEADFILNKPSFSIMADLVGRKPSVAVCEVLDARQERSNEVSKKLRRIARTATFITEERGTEDLYVGWPFVRGKFLDGTIVHGPLLFFPVQIEQQGKFWKLGRRGDELAFLNPTFAMAYGQFNQIKLPADLVEKTMDDLDRDSLVFRTQLYEWLKESPFEINFNQDLFTDTLQFFDRQTAKSLDQLERTGELKLHPEAVLGIFPQAGSFLVPDYDALIAQEEAGEPLFSRFSYPTGTKPTAFLPENKIHTPLPLDASQEAALRLVKSGQSLVVQGPPGTGKSQLIANLMADAAAAGKRVLLVCQKRAALDVVQERLRQVGMAPFLALIHDFQDDRQALYAQIATQIDQIDAYRQQNNSLNAVLLERDFDLESRRIDQTVAELTAFKEALFDTGTCGVSAKELYLTSDTNKPSISFEHSYQRFHVDNVDNYVRKLNELAAYRRRIPAGHPWVQRVSFAAFSGQDLRKADQAISQWAETARSTIQETTALMGQPLSVEQLAGWQAHDWELTALLALLHNPAESTVWTLSQYLRANATHPVLSADETTLKSLAQKWDESLAAPGPEQTLAPADIQEVTLLLDEAIQARPSWVRWNWWQVSHSGKTRLQQLSQANSLTLSETDLQTLKTKLTKRLELDAILQQARPFLADLPLPESADSLRQLQQACHITERLTTIQVLDQLPVSAWLIAHTFSDAVRALLRIAQTVDQQRAVSQLYLTDNQLNAVWKDNSYAQALQRSIHTDFDLLVEADRLYEEFSDIEKSIIEQLAEIDPDAWGAVFQNSLRLAWLDHLEQANPELRSVSSLKMTQREESLQESIRRKQALSRDILMSKLREQTYRNLTFNRLNNIVSYRELLHQTTKKRTIWPVRKLMESFADEVFKLVPCWLASPESVSAMFPLTAGLFDLVIFDEASQCFAENGIPGLFRAKQVVITGDNQQLRPSDLYRVQLDDQDADAETISAALEVESLLELASQKFPQVSLTEHYRSRSLDLITFSNTHFYQNKLQLLPYFQEINSQQPAIQYINVKGIWQNNTNAAEAEAIVQLLSQLASEHPNQSVGVVTFNYPQQQLIQELIESKRDTLLPFSLFVKNIENVQGDERDIIIFSIGYAPDERGRLAMQFGSLNTHGGANRLNVAITRARDRIYVVTSLWPDQLNVDNTTNDGPKLMKAYLTYALDVAQGRFNPQPIQSTSLPNASLLKDRLTEQHPTWKPELPFADLTVKAENRYQSLILTDDDAYFQQSLKQAHAYLPIALSLRHWPFRRVWSREFWRNSGL